MPNFIVIVAVSVSNFGTKKRPKWQILELFVPRHHNPTQLYSQNVDKPQQKMIKLPGEYTTNRFNPFFYICQETFFSIWGSPIPLPHLKYIVVVVSRSNNKLYWYLGSTLHILGMVVPYIFSKQYFCNTHTHTLSPIISWCSLSNSTMFSPSCVFSRSDFSSCVFREFNWKRKLFKDSWKVFSLPQRRTNSFRAKLSIIIL